MRTTWRRVMKTKPVTFLFAFTFLFLFSGSVYGTDLQDVVKWDFIELQRCYKQKIKYLKSTTYRHKTIEWE